MATMMSENLPASNRQISLNLDSGRHRRTRRLCIACGLVSMVCFLLGMGCFDYIVTTGTIHPGLDGFLSLGIFGLVALLGLVDLALWVIYPFTDFRLNQYVSSQQIAGSDKQDYLPSPPSDTSSPPVQYVPSTVNDGETANSAATTITSGTIPPTDQSQVKSGDLASSDAITKPLHSPSPVAPLPSIGDGLLSSVQTFPGFRYFIQPREGNNVARSQDKLNFNHEKARYAIADGVSTSFLPAQWAQIVTTQFVSTDGNFESKEEITQWLRECSRYWHKWVKDDWVPRAQKNSGQADWSRDIARGAATTLAGCIFSRDELAWKGTTTIRAVVVGDAEFFLLSRAPESIPAPDQWVCKGYYRLKLEEIEHITEAIATPERRVERDSKWVYHEKFTAKTGDCIILTTDALAKWILSRLSLGNNPWKELLSLSDSDDFNKFVRFYRSANEMETDDTTMMVIPVNDKTPNM